MEMCITLAFWRLRGANSPTVLRLSFENDNRFHFFIENSSGASVKCTFLMLFFCGLTAVRFCEKLKNIVFYSVFGLSDGLLAYFFNETLVFYRCFVVFMLFYYVFYTLSG